MGRPANYKVLQPCLTIRSRCGAILTTSREWVINHARNQIIHTFEQLKAARKQAHYAYLQTIPCFTLYQKYRGNPPLQPAQLHLLHSQIGQAQSIFQAGVDEDWRRSCLRYPEVLDYYFSLIDISMPRDDDSAVQEPRFGDQLNGPRRIKARRGSMSSGQMYKKKGRRNSMSSRGRPRTPPAAPMVDAYRR